MNKYFSIAFSDIQNTRRDPTLLLILIVPIILLTVTRFGLPELFTYFPDIANYSIPIIAFFTVLNSMFPGFIIAFILLDEKDLQLFPAIKVTPASLAGVLKTRIVFMLILGFLSSLLLLLLNGMVIFSVVKSVQISILSAMNAPIITLLISTIAKNKIEGLTLLKVANLSLLIPLILFFTDSNLEYMLSVFPAFWAYKLFDYAQNPNIAFTIGCCVLLLLNYLCLQFAKNKA